MRAKIIIGLILGLVVAAGCGGPKSGGGDSQTEVKMVLNGDFTGSPSRSGISASDQASDSYTYNLMLKVSGPSLSSPLIYYNLDYQMGSSWTCLVPNGNGMLFELIMYTVYNGPAVNNYFTFSLYVPDTPPEQRTYDLTGSPLTIALSLRYSETAEIGSEFPLGAPVAQELPPFPATAALTMNTPSGKVRVPNCPFVLQAYLIDPEFPDLVLGPALLDMSSAYADGYYYLGGIPVARRYQAKVVRPEMGWEGYSDFFTLPNKPGHRFPVNITLSGFQNLKVDPPNFPSPDGKSNFSQLLNVTGGWGGRNAYYWYFSLAYGATILQNGNTVYSSSLSNGPSLLYQITGMLRADTVEYISVYDECASAPAPLAKAGVAGAASPGYASSRAWRYKSPKISMYSPDPICYLGGDYVYVYGDNFDGSGSRLFLDENERNVQWGDSVMLEFIAPRGDKGPHKLRVQNPRRNSLLPNFNGFSDQITVQYCDSTCGGW